MSTAVLFKNAKPCPFCGSKEIEVIDNSPFAVYIGCLKCMARTGARRSLQEAADAWDCRADIRKVL